MVRGVGAGGICIGAGEGGSSCLDDLRGRELEVSGREREERVMEEVAERRRDCRTGTHEPTC
jgi:hypothetical protein